jgi:hypothetical protein
MVEQVDLMTCGFLRRIRNKKIAINKFFRQTEFDLLWVTPFGSFPFRILRPIHHRNDKITNRFLPYSGMDNFLFLTAPYYLVWVGSGG